MRFDPKLIHLDEPPLNLDGELNLPADLAALAEQLSDDAAHLAAQYPAARELRPRVGRSRASSYKRYILLGSTLAALLIAVVVWQSMPGQPAANLSTSARSPVVAMPSHSPAIAAPAANDTVSLADLSGPELEALVDMLAHDPHRVTSISF